ncbi:unnamed protein product [Heterobilharzia americana]|nr:unnamed protein product [Heterobilharzia americana]
MRSRVNKPVHNRSNTESHPPRRSRQSRPQKSDHWNANVQLNNTEPSAGSQKSRSGGGGGGVSNPSSRQQQSAQVYQE